jgi:glycosyltransferase involved in cell wall biosynthesis
LGDGLLFPKLSQLATSSNSDRIRFFGQVTHEQAKVHIAHAKLLVVPSICFEGFPVVIAEAFAFGTPVAASNVGPLPTFVDSGQNGTTFVAGDPESILKEVRQLWYAENTLARLSRAARAKYVQFYSADANYQRLMEIYSAALGNARDATVS